jgi:fumarate hydratase class I
VRVIRLPRHGASLPVGLGVSCSADRQIKAKITNEGLFVEQLEEHPEQYLPDVSAVPDVMVEVDLTQSMDDILYTLSSHPVKTIFSLTGPVIVMRDIAHAKVMEAIEK